MELIYLLIGLFVLVFIAAILWKAGLLATTLVPGNTTIRTLVSILFLFLAAAVIWYFFGGFVLLP